MKYFSFYLNYHSKHHISNISTFIANILKHVISGPRQYKFMVENGKEYLFVRYLCIYKLSCM